MDAFAALLRDFHFLPPMAGLFILLIYPKFLENSEKWQRGLRFLGLLSCMQALFFLISSGSGFSLVDEILQKRTVENTGVDIRRLLTGCLMALIGIYIESRVPKPKG